jgi:hypothetical protein
MSGGQRHHNDEENGPSHLVRHKNQRTKVMTLSTSHPRRDENADDFQQTDRCLAFVFCAYVNRFGTGIVVRLADVHNGRPFPNQTVTIQYRKIVGGSAAFETFTIRTDSNGSASFQLPTPVPPKVNVTAYDLYPCYSLLPIDTQQLRETGIASHCSTPSQGCRCRFSREADQIKARPGEVVLLARPVTRWEPASL